MEKKVLFTELVDRGSHLRKEITPTAIVTDNGKQPAGLFWDANKTIKEIVAGATDAQDTLKEIEDKLNGEITRATNKETELKTYSVADASYNSSTNQIVFVNAHGDQVGHPIDVSRFVLDGMIVDVYVLNGNLVIEFNTESGQRPIEIPLTSFFDSSQYYTITDIDGIVNTINSALNQKVSIEPGKALSSNDYTQEDKAKVALIPQDFNVSNYYTKAEIDALLNNIQSSNIVDGSVQLVDLAPEVTNRMNVDVDEPSENATFGG